MDDSFEGNAEPIICDYTTVAFAYPTLSKCEKPASRRVTWSNEGDLFYCEGHYDLVKTFVSAALSSGEAVVDKKDGHEPE